MKIMNLLTSLIGQHLFSDMNEKIELARLFLIEIRNTMYKNVEYKSMVIPMKNYLREWKYSLLDTNILLLFKSIIRKAQKQSIVSDRESELLMEELIDLLVANRAQLSLSNAQIFAVLAILKVYKKPVHEVVLNKIYHLISNPEKMELAIKVFDEMYESGASKIISIPPLPFCLPSIPIADFQGPHYLELEQLLPSLEAIGQVEIKRKRRGDILAEITLDGIDYVDEKVETIPSLRIIITNIEELERRFGGWSGNRLQKFIKDHVEKDFRTKYRKGDVI